MKNKIRYFEYKVAELFHKRKLTGTTHLCIGQEWVPVFMAEMFPEATVFGNHRSHGHYLAHTEDFYGLMAELFNKETGCCKGNGGSQHLHFGSHFFKGDFYSNGIVGGMAPVAVGHSYADKLNNKDRWTIVYLGDGALDQGVVYESMKFASENKLQIVFAFEINLMAMSTPKNSSSLALDLAEALNIRAVNVYEHAKHENLIKIDKKRKKPLIFNFHVSRLCTHSKGYTQMNDTILDDIEQDVRDEIEALIERIENE